MNASDSKSSWTARLELSATILLVAVALLVGGFTIWDRLHPRSALASRGEPAPPTMPVSIEDAQTAGDRNAKIALIEFSEFECPFCARAARDVIPELKRQYVETGKLLLAWRHYPLPTHERAQKAAEAAECAGRQGKFLEFHDWAFQHQKALDVTNLRAAATTLRLDPSVFSVCLEGQAAAKVKADVELAKSFSISGTPTWFLGLVQPDGKVKVTDRLSGAKPLADFQKAIDRAIASVNGTRE